MKCKCNNLSFSIHVKFISAFFENSVLNRRHKELSLISLCQWHNQMTHLHSSACFLHQPIKLFLRQKVTFKFWRIVLVFVFQLHIFNYDFRKINACYFLIPFFVHVLSEGRVTYFKYMGVPAPTLRMVLYFLMNWETISRRFSQFWYQSNSVEFLDYW